MGKIVNEILTLGAPLLLPPLRQRLELLQELLPRGSYLSRGQKMLLGIILRNLEDHAHVASLLGFGSESDTGGSQDLAQVLMDTLLVNLDAYTVSQIILEYLMIIKIIFRKSA